MKHHLHIDPFHGIAGDMFLGAAIDLGVSLKAIQKALQPLGLGDEYTLTHEHVMRCGVRATNAVVHTHGPADGSHHTHEHTHDHDHEHDHGHSHSHTHSHSHGDEHSHSHGHSHHHDHDHHHRRYPEIAAMIDKLDTTDRGKQRARAIVDALARAEAKVHGMKIEDVAFHEVGAIDSIVDMLGAGVVLELLDVDTITCGPIPITHGSVRCAHGEMPVPAPATAYLLQGLRVREVDRAGEWVTPTGAAICHALATPSSTLPLTQIKAVGYGAGDRDDAHAPNALRLWLGTKVATPQSDHTHHADHANPAHHAHGATHTHA